MSTLVDEQPRGSRARAQRRPEPDDAGPAPRTGPPARRRAIRARAAGPRWSPDRNGACSAGPPPRERSSAHLALDGPDRRGDRRARPGRRGGGRGGAQPAPPAGRRSPTSSPQAPAATPPAQHHPRPRNARRPPPPKRPSRPPPKPPKIPTTTSTTPQPTTGTSTTGSSHEPGKRRARPGPEGGTGEGTKLLAAVGAAARHRRRLHLQPLQPSRKLLRRPQPHDRRRQRHLLDRPGQPGDRPEHGRGAADQPQVAEEALGARARQPEQGHGRAGLRDGRNETARVDHRRGMGRADPPLRDQEDPHPLQAAQAQAGLPLRGRCGSARPPPPRSGRPPRPAT